VSGTRIPAGTVVLNQGGQTFETGRTGLTQPLTQLFKIKSGSDAARAELNATRGKARGLENDVALKVRQLYYKVMVVQSQHRADNKVERTQQMIAVSQELLATWMGPVGFVWSVPGSILYRVSLVGVRGRLRPHSQHHGPV